MLETMVDFFHARLEGYEEHMLRNIDRAEEFYPRTASLLPPFPGARVLDLGCGTGLELRYYFSLNPGAQVTGIDLASGMLLALEKNFPGKDLELICDSYFDVPFGENRFDGAVSVESLHHFTKEEKIPLYRKLRAALKPGCSFILTDYFAENDEEEAFCRQELVRLKAEENLADSAFYHYDTPLTVAHEMEALKAAGFTRVERLAQWGATSLIWADK